MNNEEKILEILTQIQQDMSGLKTAQLQTNDRLTKLEAGQARLEAGQAKLEADVSSLKTGQTKLEADVSGIRVRLDVDIQKQIDQLVDSQDEMYRKLTHVEALAEDTKEKVDVIHAVVSQHSRDIIELKKVQ